MHARKFGFSLAIAVAAVLVAGMASGQQVYKWKDSNGVTHYAQTPPATGTQYSKVSLSAGTEVTSNPAAASSAKPEASAQAHASTPAARAGGGTQDATTDNRANFCKQITANIALLQGSGPVIAASSGGKQEVLGDAGRKQQLATAHAQQAQYCKSSGT